MVNQILNTPPDLEFAGRWLGSQFKLTPKSKKQKGKIEELKKKLKELESKGGGKVDPKLQKELKDTKEQLNLILNRWTFGGEPVRTAQEFLDKFAPWINSQSETQKELKNFLKNKGVKDLKEANLQLNKGEGKINKELTDFLKFYSVANLEELKDQWENQEQDYLKQIRELKESKGEDLTPELDQLKREKGELEAEVLSINNKLKLKQQEVNRKESEIERVKKEKSSVEIFLNNRIKEVKKDLEELKRSSEELKKKYSKQGKLLDEEQTDNNKLNEKIEELENRIKELTKK